MNLMQQSPYCYAEIGNKPQYYDDGCNDDNAAKLATALLHGYLGLLDIFLSFLNLFVCLSDLLAD